MSPVEIVLYSGTAILSVGTIILVFYFFLRSDGTGQEDEQENGHE